jgi:hypothetical protein
MGRKFDKERPLVTRPLLVLVMIVKDEAHTIFKTLKSVEDIADAAVVLDTGSTDGTPTVVNGLRLASNRPMITLAEQAFVDFATARNYALSIQAHVAPATFALSLSADEVLIETTPGALRAFLDKHQDSPDGAYCIEMRSETSRWRYPRVLRTDAGWRYQGEVHEVPVGPKGETSGPLIPGVYILHSASDPERRAKRIREYDLPKLIKMVEDDSKTLPERAQSIFHLGSTYAQLAAAAPVIPGGIRLSHQMAAMACFWRYAELAEDKNIASYDPDKAYYAMALYFNLAEKIGMFSSDELERRLKHFAELAPRIPEMHYLLAAHAAQLDARRGLFFAENAARVAAKIKAAPIHVPTDERLEWLSYRLAAACAQQLGNKKRAREHAQRAVELGAPRESVKDFLP